MLHPNILHNDEICPAAAPVIAAGQTGAISGWGVFSTVRVSRGVLFEWARHFARMKHDAELMHVPFPKDAAELERSLMRLVEANGCPDCTLRICVMRNKGGLWQAPDVERDYDVIALTAELKDWGGGVRLGLAPHGRHAAARFTNAKILSWAQNLTLYEEAHEKGFDEVILLNERGEVSECTSANIFVVSGTQVWTPPLSSGCLPGVTREVILRELRVPGVTVSERDIVPADLEQASEVFITSSTRNLLPVIAVDGLQVNNSGSVREQLEDAFGRYIDAYVDAKLAARQSGTD